MMSSGRRPVRTGTQPMQAAAAQPPVSQVHDRSGGAPRQPPSKGPVSSSPHPATMSNLQSEVLEAFRSIEPRGHCVLAGHGRHRFGSAIPRAAAKRPPNSLKPTPGFKPLSPAASMWPPSRQALPQIRSSSSVPAICRRSCPWRTSLNCERNGRPKGHLSHGWSVNPTPLMAGIAPVGGFL